MRASQLGSLLLALGLAVSIAFEQIRLFGAENPVIARRLLLSFVELATIVPVCLHAHRAIHDACALHEIERLAALVRQDSVGWAT